MAPVTLGLGLINVNALIGTIFAAQLVDPTIAPNAIDKAFRVYMLPQGMFSVAVATVLFPRALPPRCPRRPRRVPRHGLARAAADRLPARPGGGRLGRARRTDRAPALPARRVRRRTRRRSSPALWRRSRSGSSFNGMMLMLNRGFFACRRRGRRPGSRSAAWSSTSFCTPRSTASASGGLPLAISLANIAAAALLILLLRRRIGGLDAAGNDAHARARDARFGRARGCVVRCLAGARRGARPLAGSADRLRRRGPCGGRYRRT